MSDVLLVQNTRIEGSGYLGELLTKDGFKIQSVHAKHEAIPEKRYSLVVILGAPESANDNLPYLQEEQKLIKQSVEQNTPVLGICLGSQLIAKTFGGKVYQGPKKEIGFYNDLIPQANSSLFSGFENPFTVFHWHGDTFDLPEGSVLLASSENYPNQAFQFKSAVGLQFHLEANEEMVNLWLDKNIDENISIVKTNMRNFYNNFKSSFQL
jgi:GMP synthase-like glutamine amidotransferase